MPEKRKRFTVTLAYSYDVDPEHYPDRDPVAMAELDLETDPTIVLSGGDWVIKGATLTAPENV